MGFDYYAVLDIPRSASEIEIRLAYRKWAVRCHPKNDFHDTPEIPFRSMSLPHYWELLNEAFDVLSNPLRKRIYDLYGEEGLKTGVVTPTGFVQPYKFSNDCMKIYKEFFATYSPYGDLIDAVTNPPPLCQNDTSLVRTKAPDIEQYVDLELEEIYHGAIKKMKITREEFVDEVQVQTKMIEETITVPITAGIATGARIRFEGAGNCSPKTFPSDIVFVVREREHERFRREGPDLHMEVRISLKDALIGFPLEFVGVDGRQLVIQIVDVVHPGYLKIIKGEGLPIPDSENQTKRGDLHITFSISFPSFISKNLREKFRLLFDEVHEATSNIE
ncbi:dnaJ homolog subfamily B member 13-like [Armigeres subalbatus]|uniref:dnaJ homolog subfamily B member 13-like n=1 Tax=Armigeres subalbatus TaxID=124917 RepID=UPI002ED13340